tara:strand:- start:1774 stop:2067 length:294 start_codon:yes stop_codon:yes gene_type:complete
MKMRLSTLGSISKNRRLANNSLVESKDRIFHFLLRRTRNKEDAEDVLQAIFVRVLTRVKDLHNWEKIRGWLSSMLRSVLSDHFRKRTIYASRSSCQR